MDGQFDNSFAQVDLALAREAIDWSHVREATLFLERGAAELAWLKERFLRAAARCLSIAI